MWPIDFWKGVCGKRTLEELSAIYGRRRVFPVDFGLLARQAD